MANKLIVVLIALSVMSGCATLGLKQGNTLVGTWTGEFPNMGKMSIVFHKDMTMKGSIGDTFDFTGTYSIDYSANPMTVDQFVLDNPQMGDITYLAIFKFLDPNKVMMCGNVDSQGGRPSDFNNMAYELTRE